MQNYAFGVDDKPVAADVFEPLSKEQINVDNDTNISADGKTDLTFSTKDKKTKMLFH